jgi:4-carboxymuconolactone decarboxylase
LPAERRSEDRALSRADAGLVALSAAIAGGDAGSVAAGAEGAIREGASPAALYETLLQSYLFLGFPRAIEALFAAGPVLKRHGAAPPAAGPVDPERWIRAGETLCRSVYGRNYEKLVERMRGLSPDLASWMILEGYGKTLSRPGLSAATREYCVVAILATTRMWRQLRSHAIGAVHVGGTRAGVRESIELCGPIAGEETVREALRVTGGEAPHAGG